MKCSRALNSYIAGSESTSQTSGLTAVPKARFMDRLSFMSSWELLVMYLTIAREYRRLCSQSNPLLTAVRSQRWPDILLLNHINKLADPN